MNQIYNLALMWKSRYMGRTANVLMVYSDQTANEARPVDIAKVKEARPAVSKNTLDEI